MPIINVGKAGSRPSVLFALDSVDISYTKALHSSVVKHFSAMNYFAGVPSGRDMLLEIAAKKGCKFILTTSIKTFKFFHPLLEGSYNDNVGTVVENIYKGEKYRIILVPAFRTIWSQNHGKFVMEHYLDKLANGGIVTKDKFTWTFLTPSNLAKALQDAEDSFLCAVDIETGKAELLIITSCSWTFGFYDDSGNIYTRTYVINTSDQPVEFWHTAMRQLNSTKVAKVMQNGQYDSAYFIRFNVPLYAWLYDTMGMMHCLFSELPKDLAYVSSFFVEDFRYWKDEASTNLYEYNGKDTHNTFWVFIGMLKYIKKTNSEYALSNYAESHKDNFPMLSCGLDGLLCDDEVRLHLRAEAENSANYSLESLRMLIDEPNFNPGSPKQVLALFKSFGHELTSSDEKNLTALIDKDELMRRLVDKILDYRGKVKAIGTYFDMKLLNGIMLYKLDPWGTKSGRTASSSSPFWCGANIQNQPPYCRQMFKANDGWTFTAEDKSQSESFCTGYLSQESALIDAVNNSPDFHCHNASKFFGIPFEKLFDKDYIDPKTGEKGKKLNKAIRDLAKKVNHGANYNMSPPVLIDTMGVKNVIKAKELLGLPDNFTPLDTATYLMTMFDNTYPRIRKQWYNELTKEVLTTGKLTIPCIGWVRRTFLRPTKSKLDVNEMVSHKPQSLSVKLVNRALYNIWTELQLKKYNGKFRLKAQIHDEILSMVKDEILDEASKEVADMMVIPTTIEGRLMSIPSSIAVGKTWDKCK